MKYFRLLLLLLLPASAFAQQMSPEEAEKQMYEYIEKELERLEYSLDLNTAQVFWADSIMTHNLTAMNREFGMLASKRVENRDIYQDVQDKWAEASYQAFRKILDDTQWAQYLKMGAAKDKKERDKRAAKRAGNK